MLGQNNFLGAIRQQELPVPHLSITPHHLIAAAGWRMVKGSIGRLAPEVHLGHGTPHSRMTKRVMAVLVACSARFAPDVSHPAPGVNMRAFPFRREGELFFWLVAL
jgi:hypothetical protein